MLPREHVDRYQRSIRKHQKSTSTGGGRAWSEEEVSADARDVADLKQLTRI